MKVRTRIAPSPTGYPHIGTIYQALINRTYATKHNGQFIVRIEDTDRSRFVEDAEEKLYQALDWFDIHEDESVRKGGPKAPYKQSERLDLYKHHIQKLLDEGNAYPCFCSSERLDEVRKQMQKDGKPPMYDKHCRNLTKEESQKRIKAGEKYVIRLKVPQDQTIKVEDAIRGTIEFKSNTVDDQVLIKSDGFPTYHFAVVVDDHLMEITHAVRGEEWIPSAPKHILVYQFLGWEPPVWVHTPTLRNPDKSKLSKRQGHTNVSWYMEQGYLPQAVINFLSQLGWTHPDQKEIFTQEEFTNLFDFKDLSPAGPVFDETKLKWMNGKYIRELSDTDLKQAIQTYLKDYQDNSELNPLKLQVNTYDLDKLLPLIKERLEVFSDIFDLSKFMQKDLKIDQDTLANQTNQSPAEQAKLLQTIKTKLQNIEDWSVQSIEEAIRSTKPEFPDFKPRDFFMSIRVAITGYPVTPPLFESIDILGREEVLSRLDQVSK